MKENELVARNGTDCIDNIDPVKGHLIVSFETTNILDLPLRDKEELVSILATISRKSVMETFLMITKRRAATSLTLETELGVNHATLFRTLKSLLGLRLIVRALPMSSGRAGRKSTIYALPDYTAVDVQRAIHDDRIIRTPGYAECERLGQLAITDYLDYVSEDDGKIKRERVHEVMRKECRGFRWFDLKREVEGYIFRKGFKLI